jgi:hypothetical protein
VGCIVLRDVRLSMLSIVKGVSFAPSKRRISGALRHSENRKKYAFCDNRAGGNI